MKSRPDDYYRFPEIRVVEASAGAGKTFALAKRYVQLLLSPQLGRSPISLRSILAITFTNKASFEMKERILLFLKKIALKQLTDAEEADILKPISLTQAKASDRAYELMGEIIRHYNYFQVQTIDSFINALLSGCAFRIGLSANFRIKRNYSAYLHYSLDQLIRQAADDSVLFEQFALFLRHYLFQENKPGWFPKKDMLALLTALYQKHNAYGHEFVTSPFQGKDLMKKKITTLKVMRDLNDVLKDGVNKQFRTWLANFISKNKNGFDFKTLSKYLYHPELPVNKGGKAAPSADKLWMRMREHLKELSEWEAYSLFDPYIDVFNNVSGIFHRQAAKDDVMFLEELNTKARFLFDAGGVSVEELYYRMATRFQHYLIDEFQDTSPLHWQNLFLMVEEALSTDGSLFYVGDKKQAIYGFRGGDVRLFDEAQKQFPSCRIHHERLATNYRSERAIVDFVNRIFSKENLKRFIDSKQDYDAKKKKKDNRLVFLEDDREEINNVFGQGQQEILQEKNGGYVKVEFISEKKKEERDEVTRQKLTALIGELAKRYDYRQMTVLTRKNSEIEQVTSWLLQEGIFVESKRTLNIKENTLVCEIICLLEFLDSPIDNMAFARFIMGDIFTSVSGLKDEEVQAFIFKQRSRLASEKGFTLYKEFAKAYPQVWENYLGEYFKNVGLYPVYELVISIVHHLKILSRFPDQQGFVMKFLELIKDQEEESSDLTTFLETYQELADESVYVNVSDSNAVRVLTIHEAKGLGFDVVVLPFLEMDVSASKSGEPGQVSFITNIDSAHLELLRIKKEYLHFSDKLRDIYQKEYLKSFISELSNIYVALTRAVTEMYVFVPNSVGVSFNFVNLLIPQELSECGKRPKMADKEKKELEARTKLPISEHHDWIQFMKDEFTRPGDLANRELIREGEIYHTILSFIGNLAGEEVSRSLDCALEKTMDIYPHLENLSEYAAVIRALIEDEQFKDFFFVEGGFVEQEVEIVNASGHLRRIDRLIISHDEVWVIDYKLAKAQDSNAYEEQVKGYMKAISHIYPGKMIKGMIIYLSERELEEVGAKECLRS